MLLSNCRNQLLQILVIWQSSNNFSVCIEILIYMYIIVFSMIPDLCFHTVTIKLILYEYIKNSYGKDSFN